MPGDSTEVSYVFCLWLTARSLPSCCSQMIPSSFKLIPARVGRGRDVQHYKAWCWGREDSELGGPDFQIQLFIHVYVISHRSNWTFSLKLQTCCSSCLTLPQLVDVCIISSYMKCQLWSIFVKYTSRALYLTNCELMSVECEIPFLCFYPLHFFLWTVFHWEDYYFPLHKHLYYFML